MQKCGIMYECLLILTEKEANAMQITFLVLHLIVALALIFIVLVQEGKDPGMKGIQGAATDMGDSFFKKAGGTTKEKMFNRMTTTLSILFLITTLALIILAA